MSALGQSFLVLSVGCLGWALGCGVVFHLRHRKRWAREAEENKRTAAALAEVLRDVPQVTQETYDELQRITRGKERRILAEVEHRLSRPRRFK